MCWWVYVKHKDNIIHSSSFPESCYVDNEKAARDHMKDIQEAFPGCYIYLENDKGVVESFLTQG